MWTLARGWFPSPFFIIFESVDNLNQGTIPHLTWYDKSGKPFGG